MELKELYDSTLELFGVSDAKQLSTVLAEAANDEEKMSAFCKLIDGDLSVDWLQKIYQYYLADRKEKKQDYTPTSIAQLIGMLAGSPRMIVDMCAGSGALIIQKWNQNPDIVFTAIEIDENVIPFLLFNMALRNIHCKVYQVNALTGEKTVKAWEVTKGDRFGHITNIKSSI